MGFLAGLNPNKTLFGRDAYKHAIRNQKNNDLPGYAVIRIKPAKDNFTKRQDPIIIGVVQEPPKIAMGADWTTTMGGLAGQLLPPTLSKIGDIYKGGLNVLGYADPGQAFASRKIYTNSGDLRISVVMKIVDWQGVGMPITSGRLLLGYVLPKLATTIPNEAMKVAESIVVGGQNIADTIKNFGQKEFEGVKNAEENSTTNKIEEGTTNPTNAALYAEGQAVAQFGKSVVSKAGEGLDDFLNIKSSPTPVDVAIGHYFHHSDMVITNVELSFSKQATKKGPLWLEASLEMASRRNITSVDETGVVPRNKVGRVSVLNSGDQSSLNAVGRI